MVRCSEHRRKSDRKEIKVSRGLEVNVEKHIRYRLVFFVFQQSGISFSFIVLYIEQRHRYYSLFLIRYKLYGCKRRDGTEDKVNTHPIVPQQSRTQPSRTSKHKTHTSSKQTEKTTETFVHAQCIRETRNTATIYICIFIELLLLLYAVVSVELHPKCEGFFSIRSFLRVLVRSFLVSNFVTLFFFFVCLE